MIAKLIFAVYSEIEVARGKFAAVTRAERAVQAGKATNLHNQAEKIRERCIEFALRVTYW